MQTRSRLNRAHPGKDRTYILDFQNDPAEILQAFRTYYETAELEATTDPNLVYDLRAKLDASGYYDEFEVDRVAKVELDPNGRQSQLVAALQPVADRLLKGYKAAQQARAAAEAAGDASAAQAAKDTLDALVLFKGDMGTFVRAYAFLSQMFDYGNTAIEKRFMFYKRLIPLLEFGRERDTVDLSQVVLTHHTLRSGGKQALRLAEAQGEYRLSPMDAAGSGVVQEKDRVLLAEIIEKVNGLFESQVGENDKLRYFEGIRGKLIDDERLIDQSMVNSGVQFANSPDLRSAFLDAVIDQEEANSSLSSELINNDRQREQMLDLLLNAGRLYDLLRAKGQQRTMER